jgi:hypothetical protein
MTMPTMTKPRLKSVQGYWTKPNVWDLARKLEMYRGGEKIDPGVVFFIAILNQLNIETQYSCEGHNDGFYITFRTTYSQAQRIFSVGYFSVEIESGNNHWSLRINRDQGKRQKVDCLRHAAEAWNDNLGPFKPDEVRLT